jgi:protein-S-isoprenylcysteine O-methyltransferase Ste14
MAQTSERSLERRSAQSTAAVMAAQAVTLFLAAGTLHYWQAWLYLGLQLASMTAINRYLLRHDRALLRRRLAADEKGESERVQKVFLALLRPLGLAMLLVAGLDRRFGWSSVPPVVVAMAAAVLAAGTLIIFFTFRENSHTSSVIEVEAGQSVVTTGPYRFVRHPMYSGALLGVAATPLALGSFRAELLVPLAFALFVVRLLAEERFLAERLPGYAEYLKKTRARLVPGVW